jgi:hypothetical protein
VSIPPRPSSPRARAVGRPGSHGRARGRRPGSGWPRRSTPSQPRTAQGTSGRPSTPTWANLTAGDRVAVIDRRQNDTDDQACDEGTAQDRLVGGDGDPCSNSIHDLSKINRPDSLAWPPSTGTRRLYIRLERANKPQREVTIPRVRYRPGTMWITSSGLIQKRGERGCLVLRRDGRRVDGRRRSRDGGRRRHGLGRHAPAVRSSAARTVSRSLNHLGLMSACTA